MNATLISLNGAVLYRITWGVSMSSETVEDSGICELVGWIATHLEESIWMARLNLIRRL